MIRQVIGGLDASRLLRPGPQGVAIASFALFVLSVVPRVLAGEGASIKNLGAGSAVLEGDWLAYSQWELFKGEDLNGDGDTTDQVVHVHKLLTGEITNLGIAGLVATVSGDWLAFVVSERQQGEDCADGARSELIGPLKLTGLSWRRIRERCRGGDRGHGTDPRACLT